MARSRNLKPGFFKNADLAAMGERTQLLFAGLWPLADREGRLKDDPRWIRVECLPYSPVVDADVDAMLTALAGGDDPFIQRYEVDGRKYIQVVNWHEHQSPHHTEKESRIPAAPVIAPLINGSLTTNSPCPHIEGIRNQESVRGNQQQDPPTRKKPFSPPTVDDVAAYCRERKNRVDAETFVNFYQSKGWKVGKNTMADWKAAIHTWERNSGARGSPDAGSAPRTRNGSEIIPLA